MRAAGSAPQLGRSGHGSRRALAGGFRRADQSRHGEVGRDRPSPWRQARLTAMPQFALGQGISRLEDDTLLRGAGRYTDDFALPRAAHAVIVRSPHAHASIRRVATERAKGAAGVIAVLTGKDAAADGLGHIQCLIPVVNLDGTNRKETPRPVLALDKVAHVGDPVAMVIAGTLAQARDAADLVEVDYAPLPAVTDVREGEVAFDIDLGDSRDKVAAAFAKAAHVTRLELVNNRLVANPIEPRAALAEYDAATDRITLYTPSQGPHHLRGQIAAIVKNEDVRVVSGNVGGAFGMKIFLYPEQPLMAWAARRASSASRPTSCAGAISSRHRRCPTRRRWRAATTPATSPR